MNSPTALLSKKLLIIFSLLKNAESSMITLRWFLSVRLMVTDMMDEI